jgi:hypothetical protein
VVATRAMEKRKPNPTPTSNLASKKFVANQGAHAWHALCRLSNADAMIAVAREMWCLLPLALPRALL